MTQYEKFYKTGRQGSSELDQLIQLLRIVCDGDLISKTERDELVKIGFAVRGSGYNIITPEGIEYLEKSGYIHC